MTCKKCGATMPEGQAFCPDCGAPLTEELRQPEIDSPAEVPQAPKARRKLGWIIALAAAVAVIAGVALSWGYIGGLVERTFSSPADYYHKVETRALHTGTDALAHPTGLTAMSARLLGMGTPEAGKATQGNLTLTVGEKLTSLLSDSAGADLSWLKSVGLSFVLDGSRSELMGAKANLQLNGTDVVSLEGMYHPETYMGYFRVPELSGQYASVDAEELLNDYYWEHGYDGLLQIMSAAIYSGQSEYQTVLNAMPSPETFAALVDRYGAVIINDLTDVERSRETVTAQDVSCTYTALTVRADRATLEKILRDVLTTAADDPDLKDIIVNLSGQLDVDGAEAYQSFQDSIRETLDEDTLIDSDIDAAMVVYVDDKGEIHGRDVQITADGETVTMHQIYAVKGSRFGMDYRMEVPGEFNLSLTGSGTTHGNSLKGTLDLQLTANGTAMDLFTAEIDGTAKGGDFRGEIVLIPTEELLNTVLANNDMPAEIQELVRGLRFIFVNHSDDDHLDLKLAVCSGESEFFAILLESSKAEPLELTVPADAVDVEDWAGSINQFSFMTLIGNLQKAGIPTSFFAGLSGLS